MRYKYSFYLPISSHHYFFIKTMKQYDVCEFSISTVVEIRGTSLKYAHFQS